MKIVTITTLLLSSLATLAEPRPNVIIIYGDDVGYGDVGVYGSEKIPTPHIDKLASEGLVFTDGHCGAATCTPSRFSLLTGVYGFRHNANILPPDAPLLIPTNILTLPKLFKSAGYDTAVIGKWHLGLGKKGVKTNWNGAVKPGPLEIGFDYSFLLPSTNDRVPCVYLENHHVVNLDPKDPLFVGRNIPKEHNSTVYPDGRKTPEAMTYYPSSHGHNHSVINGIGRIGTQVGGKSALWNGETMADEFVNQTKKYLDAQAKKDTPFFLYFASQDIHVPRAPHPRFHGKTDTGFRGDAMVQFDWSTGAILEHVKQLGMEENTIIIFSSDNGPVYDDGYKDGTITLTSQKETDQGHDGSGIYRGGKYQIYEGGTRVPFIIKWPAAIQPGRSDAMVNQIDLLASFADLLDIEVPANEAIDSRNTLAAFLGKQREASSGLEYSFQEAAHQQIALRHNQWKLIHKRKNKHVELYNLAKDPSEQDNILQKHPEKAEAMQQTLSNILEAENGIRDIELN
ncbi:sulfatase family protein [Rubritalea marina]|uniref:sulfatase family protein n=1 Tax=Rubritalea marina TaxID=361055 RepID=UPI00035F12EE|nr:arylsulfatase [Rubritalea marina]